MAAIVESVAIKSLFGNRNIFLDFREDVKILVGENGLGKTTISKDFLETFNQEKRFDFNKNLSTILARLSFAADTTEGLRTYLRNRL